MHHYNLKHPSPLTPPLTPSSSINNSAHPSDDVQSTDSHSRIVLLSNLIPTLDPALLERTIHHILASSPSQKLRIKGINTRPLPSTHSVPVVFFDSRDATSLYHAVTSGSSLLDPLANSPDGPVAAEIISVNQLVKDIGPSPFLDSIDASFHLRVQATKQINLPILQSLLSSFGELRTFTPEPNPDTEIAIYHIEYFDSRDGDRAIHDLDGKVLFAMSLSVDPSPDSQTQSDVEFPSISTPPSSSHADADTCQKPTIGPPGSVSNLRVRFRSLDFAEKPTVLYASSPDPTATPDPSSPDPEPADASCVYCPYPPPPTPDSGIVYYPSLSAPYDYIDPHYPLPSPAPPPAPAWCGYDPSSMMMPFGMVPLPMNIIPPPHGYYEGASAGGGGRGYVVPYPPPYQPQYGVYGHLQQQPQQYNQRFIAGTPSRSGSGSSVGSSTGSNGYRFKDREKDCLSEHQPRGCSCSGNGTPAPAPVRVEDTQVVEPVTTTTPPSERNQLNIKRIEEGVDTRTTVMIKNIPNKMSDRDLMVFIERVCPRRIDFFYLRMDFQNGCNVGYAFVNFIHVQDLLGFAKARLGVKWNMFSSEKVLQMSYANYQGKEALVEKFKNSAIMDEREAWRPRIFYSSGPNQGFPEPFPPPTHMRRKERSFFNRGALFVPGPGAGVDGRKGLMMRKDTQGLSSRNLGLTFGKGWVGRTRNDQEGEAEEVFGGGV